MLFVPPPPFFAQPKILAFVTSAEDPSSLTTYTFSSQSIGAADSNRTVIVGLSGIGGNNTTLSSATIGGVSASIVVQENNGLVTSAIIAALVTTGTTADVVLTFSAGKARAAIGIWRATGITATPHDTDGDSSNNPDMTLNTVSGGFGIAHAGQNTSSGTVSWTGVTKRYEEFPNGRPISGGDAATSGTPLNAVATHSSSAAAAGVAASW